MATLEDQKNFKKYQELYRNSLQFRPCKEEIEKMLKLETLSRPEIGEPIVDESDQVIFAKSSLKRGGRTLPIEARLGFQIHHLIFYQKVEEKEEIIYV